MFEEDYDDKIYNLIISNGFDKEHEYRQFVEKIYSKPEFLWKESISGSYASASPEFFENIDAIILLAGLYNYNEDTFNDLLEASEKYDIPIVLVRPYGLEEVPEKLEEKAKTIVGWNANCIIDSIKSAINLNENEECEL
ncbi:MAG: nuclease [Methanobrevibacter sp.]|uniref:nuclease n=1 Tax=Methanobrevibacter sp. TaxID=66852 RepID=UPI0026DEDB12|nr:nuclease [Methanobrevibacter sp.]MDO5849222.1 nuclease [Methanobrevibacter sp.]